MEKWHAAGVGATLLTTVEIKHLLACNEDECIDLAVALAGNDDLLSVIRSEMRLKMRRSPLCDYRMFATQVEDVYRDFWKKWCRS